LSGAPQSLPDQIGDYRILSEAGRGGQSVVYKAVHIHDECEQIVALKVLPPGVDQQRWGRDFKREQRILANLEHPYIVGWREGSQTADGQPFLVMEYIEGLSLSQYCRDHQLTLKARILLFCKVCEAVAFAHRNLVLHLDLKPENILITADGNPKLVDFGIAKILSSNDPNATGTLSTAQWFTPTYASPEWLAGKRLTVMSDVYALGVILYEILTGTLPQRSEAEIIHAFYGDGHLQLDKPSQVAGNAELRGDLDSIVLTALHIDPKQRYQSVLLLQQDLERYLNSYPVRARKAYLYYTAGKFIYRNRYRLIAYLGILLLAVITLFQITEGFFKRRLAQIQSEQLTQYSVSLLELQDPTSFVEPETVDQLFKDAEAEVNALFANQPLQQAQLLFFMSRLAIDRKSPQQAKRLLDKAIEIQRKHQQDEAMLLRMQVELGNWHFHQHAYPEAYAIYLEMLPAISKDSHDDMLLYREVLGNAIRTAFRLGEKERASAWIARAKKELENDPTAPARWVAEVATLEREMANYATK
jgi:serine/threonine protein kinase